MRCASKTLKTFNFSIFIIMTFTFTEQQSSCIASVDVEGQEVSITFQSNLDKVYTFVTESEDAIVNYLQNPSGSIGQTYRRWVAESMLIPADQLAAV
jgi:hypothetical protein